MTAIQPILLWSDLFIWLLVGAGIVAGWWSSRQPPLRAAWARVARNRVGMASATLLAPSVTFTENIWRQFRPRVSDRQELRTMRVTVLVFSAFVLCYAIYMQGTSIYEMVSGAYQVTLVGAFVPLVFGLYWKRATTQGAIFSIVLGILTWLLFLVTPAGADFPAQLAGVLASLVGMVVGSVGPQAIRNSHGSHHKLAGAA